MTDQIIQSIVTFFQDKIPNELTVFIISVLPVLELRGGHDGEKTARFVGKNPGEDVLKATVKDSEPDVHPFP